MKHLFLSLSVFAFSAQAFAYDFSTADALFNQREGNFEKVHQAQSAYSAAFSTALTSDEKIYAVEQMARLSYYEILMLETNNEAIKPIALSCYDNTTKLAGTNSPQYFYWRASCLSLWAKANGVLASLSRSKEVVDLIESGITVEPTYEGGGFHRLGAAVYSRLPAINPVGPRGDINKASDYISKAIASAAYAGSIDTSTATGDYFFNAYEYQAEILAKQGKREKAIEVLNTQIARIQTGDLPVGREAETLRHLEVLKTLVTQL